MATTEAQRAKMREYHAAHREEHNARNREYRAAHREERKAYDREYRATHRAEHNAREQKRRDEHREEYNARSRAHYAANREERLAWQREYRAANPEQRKATLERYRAAHREELLAYGREHARAFRAENPERARAVGRAYRAADSGYAMGRATVSRTAARNRGAVIDPELTSAILAQLLRDRQGCESCAGSIALHERKIDHRIAIAFGGEHSEGNINILCEPCHQVKSKTEKALIRKLSNGATQTDFALAV
jgi:HNH endonuclease